MIFIISIFLTGSAIGDAAQSMAMLVAGLAVQVPPIIIPKVSRHADIRQGIGGGGIPMLTNLITSDIVPRHRTSLRARILPGSCSDCCTCRDSLRPICWWNDRPTHDLAIGIPAEPPIGGLALFLVVAFSKVNYNR
jgi:hypothetical protein